MIKILIICLCGVWILQSLLGYFQMKRFTKEFNRLRRQGKVAIGKDTGRTKIGTIVMICIDETANVIEAEVMSGITVFARLKPIDELKSQNLQNINKSILKRFNKKTIKAIDNAVENYYAFKEVKTENT